MYVVLQKNEYLMGSDGTIYDFGTHTINSNEFNTLEEASKIVRNYIEQYDIGSNLFSGGDVYEKGNLVAKVGYNGKVWDINGEIIYNPYDKERREIMRKCPKCNRLYSDYPAISRRDNKTEICSECGTKEALLDYAMSKIKLEEKYVHEATTTFYFIAPKEMLDDYSDEDVSATISIEVPNNNIEARYANVSISPTKEIDGALEDYDWNTMGLTYEAIEVLLERAKWGN